MGLLTTLRNWVTPLSNNDRQQIWKMFGSFKSNQLALQGNSMIEGSYEQNVDIYAVIRKIVDITKSLDWVVEENRGGKWELIENTSLHDLINMPNFSKGYTWNDIEEQVLVYLLTTGNAYMVGNTQINKTLIEEVDVLPSNNVCIEIVNKNYFMPEVEYEFNIGNQEYEFTKEQIAHIRFFNPAYSTIQESLYGLSPIQVAAKVVQTGNDRWDAHANLLQNRGAVGLITDKSSRPMLPDEAAKVQSDWNAQTAGTGNFGKIKVTNKDLAYIQMAMSPSDLQILETGVVSLRAICNVFGLDSSLFNDPENKTYSNRTEAERSMYTNCIMPISNKLSESFTYFLCRNHFPNRHVRMRQDFSRIEALQQNFKEKADIYNMLKNSGIITANDVARALNLTESVDANADKLIISNNQTLLDSIGEHTQTPQING
jgi:HK97 family phage portal protein